VIPKSLIKRILRITLGILFLLLGVIGGFLPVVQGWIFILVGFYLLSYDIPIVRRHLDRLKKRFPRHAKGLRRTESRMILRWRIVKRFFSRKTPNAVPASDRQAAKNTKSDTAQ
jgi:hypothetical protein